MRLPARIFGFVCLPFPAAELALDKRYQFLLGSQRLLHTRRQFICTWSRVMEAARRTGSTVINVRRVADVSHALAENALISVKYPYQRPTWSENQDLRKAFIIIGIISGFSIVIICSLIRTILSEIKCNDFLINYQVSVGSGYNCHYQI